MEPTQEQLNNRIAGVGTITPESLEPVAPFKLPDAPTLPTYSLANFSIEDAINANNAPTGAEAERKTGLARLSELTKSIFNKGTDQQATENALGIPGLNKQLTEASNNFRTTVAEQNNLIQEAGMIPLQQQENFAGRGVTEAGGRPITAGELRKNAIKQYQVTSKGLFQQAIVANLRDDIAGAEAAVKKAIEFKYAPIQQEIDFVKDFLQYNSQDLSREDAKKAKNLELVLNERIRLLAEQKEDDTIKQGFLAEAISTSRKNGVDIPTLIINRANEAKTPIEALQILSPYMTDNEAKEDALLDRQLKRAQLNKVQAEIDKIQSEGKTVTVDQSGRIVLPNIEDAQKITKEIAGTDAFKSITKAKDSLQFLSEFEKTFNETGATSAVFSPRENAKLKAKYNSTILNLKEFFNLGVLNGPDETILKGIVPDPTNRSAALSVGTLGAYKPSTATKAGIDNMKQQIEQTLDERYSSIVTQYGAYSPQSVSALNDLNRIYVEQKAKLNPEVAKLKQEHPELSDEDIITILGK